MSGPAGAPHYPRPAPIDGYGRGGFAFAGMSHRGSLLCLPSGIWGWDVARTADIGTASLQRVLDEAADIGLLLIGTGGARWSVPDALRLELHRAGIAVEAARTGTAVSTYNILLDEGRRVAAALVATP